MNSKVLYHGNVLWAYKSWQSGRYLEKYLALFFFVFFLFCLLLFFFYRSEGIFSLRRRGCGFRRDPTEVRVSLDCQWVLYLWRSGGALPRKMGGVWAAAA